MFTIKFISASEPTWRRNGTAGKIGILNFERLRPKNIYVAPEPKCVQRHVIKKLIGLKTHALEQHALRSAQKLPAGMQTCKERQKTDPTPNPNPELITEVVGVLVVVIVGVGQKLFVTVLLSTTVARGRVIVFVENPTHPGVRVIVLVVF